MGVEVVFKHQVVGRLGLFVGFLVLASACTGGQIGDVPGGARLGPEAGDPEIGNEVAPLACAGASPDVSAQNGWQSSDASLPADGVLRFELKARPTAANLDGLVAVGAEDIDDFAKTAIAVRFADNGLVDVRDGAFYSSDLAYPYDSGVWYSIAISADIDAETYDVEIGPCGEPRQSLINDASFRDSANVSGQLSAWAVWSSQAAALEVSTPAWMNSGGCAPATCLSLGHACGAPQDGCGGVLSCGVCGDGETCLSGTCVDAPANASPPPPPSCTPTTCQSLGRECGQWGDGCGGILSCGSCNGGELCSVGVCIDVPPSAPPPPACTPTTCQSLGTECGQWGDGCGGILNCGSCSGGATCSTSGVCVAPAPPPPACTPASCQALSAECGLQSDGCGGLVNCGSCGGGETCNGSGQCVTSSGSNWWETVTKPNASNTGPNCTGRAGCPSATLLPGNAPPAVVTQDGATYENFIMTSGFSEGLAAIEIRAQNVTFRNFYIDHGSWVGISVIDTPNANFIMEYGEMNGDSSCTTHLDGNGFTARYTQFHTCDDILQTNNSVGSNGPVLVEDSYWYEANGGHGDIVMLWPIVDSDTTFRHNVLVGGSTSIVIDDFVSGGATVLFEENWMYGNTQFGGTAFHVYCDTGGGGTRIIRKNLFDRNFNYGPFDSDECDIGDGNFYEDNFSPVPYP